jgi:hypothetical protein
MRFKAVRVQKYRSIRDTEWSDVPNRRRARRMASLARTELPTPAVPDSEPSTDKLALLGCEPR